MEDLALTFLTLPRQGRNYSQRIFSTAGSILLWQVILWLSAFPFHCFKSSTSSQALVDAEPCKGSLTDDAERDTV